MFIKLFVGILMTSEIRMHLQASISWKQMVILPSDKHDLQMTYFQQKEYLGNFLEMNQFSNHAIPIEKIKAVQKKIQSALQAYCPEYDQDQASFSIFSQLFLT